MLWPYMSGRVQHSKGLISLNLPSMSKAGKNQQLTDGSNSGKKIISCGIFLMEYWWTFDGMFGFISMSDEEYVPASRTTQLPCCIGTVAFLS